MRRHIVDRERVCDCQFKRTCKTFNDPLIEAKCKTACGHGCLQQTDYYRSRHCQAFRCVYLTAVVSEALRHAPAQAGRANTSANGG